MPNATGALTEEEVEAIFAQHGKEDAEDESPEVEEDSPEDEAEEEQQEEKAEESEASEKEDDAEEESEEEEAEESEDKLDWSKLDKRYSEAFEKSAAEAQKWQKAHSKLQSQLTKESKGRQEEEGTLEELRAYANQARQFESLLTKHPELQQVLERELQRLSDPDRDVPDYVKKDPVWQQIQRRNQLLEQRLAQFEQKLSPVDEIRAERQESRNRERLNGLMSDANEKFKSMFGKDMGEAEKTSVLQYMVENKYYQNGKNVALAVFADQYEKALREKNVTSLKAKAQKFGGRTKGVNPGKSSKISQDAGSVDEAIARALSEQGYGT